MIAAGMLFSSAAASADEVVVLPFSSITEELIESFFGENGSNVVLEFPAGSKIPCGFIFSGDFFELNTFDSLDHMITVKKSCYMKMESDIPYFSADLTHWKDIFKFFTGSFAFSVQVKDDQPFIGFSAVLNPRESSDSP